MKRLLVLLLAALVLSGCRMATIRNVEEAPLARFDGRELSMQELAIAIGSAGSELGWVMQPVEPGHMVGILNVRSHRAVVDVFYDSDSFSIEYKDSSNLLFYRPNRIHKKYNQWVANLETGIMRAVQRAE